jgi:hypothetical protein
MTDTERIDWIERNNATVHAFADEAWRNQGFAVHSNLIGWMPTARTARAAIDEAARRVMEERRHKT